MSAILALLLAGQLAAPSPTASPETICTTLSLDVRRRRDGSIRSCVQTDQHGRPDGVAIRFHRSGTVALVGSLQNEEMTGVWSAYSVDGARLWRGSVAAGALTTSVPAEEYVFMMRNPRWVAGDKVFWCSPETKPLVGSGDVRGGSAQDCSEDF
jgi:hypothetical protein